MEEDTRWQESEYDEDPGLEKTALVDKQPGESKEADSEVYSTKKFVKALSFRIGLVASVVVLVVLVVIVAIVAGVIVGNASKNRSQLNRLTLDDVFDPRFQTRAFQGSWIDDRIVSLSTQGGVTLLEPSSGQVTSLISAAELRNLSEILGRVSEVVLSPVFLAGGVEDQVMLLVANSTSVYRHSELADYYLYCAACGEVLRNVAKPEDLEHFQFQYVTWSPNGRMLAYVLEYNVYVVDASGGSAPIAITTGGAKNGVVYGIPDWVYEEEVISSDHTLWWSPDSTKLLFAGFDDSAVKPYSFPIYGGVEQQYDTIDTIAYPKPGTPNPVVSVYVTSLEAPQPNNVTLQSETLSEVDHYMAYAGWINSSHAYVAWLNRTQNYIEFCSYDYQDTSVECDMVYSYSVVDGWIEQYDSTNVLLYSDSSGTTLMTLLARSDADDSSTHLAVVQAEDSPTFLTGPGIWEVTDIVGHSEDHILYVSTERGPRQRHLYSYNMATQQSVCLSCDQSDWNIPDSPNPVIPSSCDYFHVSCDRQLEYCLLNCRGPCVPYVLLAQHNKELGRLQGYRMMEGNADLRDAITSLDLPRRETFTVQDGDGPVLNGRALLPPGFDSSKKYPVLMYVYGGPASQVVDDASSLLSLSHLFYSSDLDLILASVDGRGTGLRGNNFKFSVYKDLGRLETIDQIRAGSQYFQNLPYVDDSKLAIYGSSYGGYMAAMVGSSGSGVFSAAISQSPVSDWHYYDSIYTERYMLEPQDNGDAYKRSSVLFRAEKLADVDFLLIHGTGDDNVHYQHTAQLAEALAEADVQFRMQVYTDKDHSLSGGNTRRHLYQLIADFLRESFQLQTI